MRLKDWCFLGNYEFFTNRLQILATNDLPAEKWSYAGKSDFGILSLSHSLRQETPEEITFEDAESLLYEASRKMESINGAVLLQSEFQPKTLKK